MPNSYQIVVGYASAGYYTAMTLPFLKSCHIITGYASFGTDQFFHSGISVSFSYYMAMTLSLLKSSHITAGYASFDTDQYHGTGMPVSFSNYLTLTSPMGSKKIFTKVPGK